MPLDRESSPWAGRIIIALIVVILYGYRAYDSMFDRRPGYLYTPDTDELFYFEMAPTLSRYSKWEPFIPFKSLHYGRPEVGERLGNLHQIVDEAIASRELLSRSIDAWAEAQMSDMRIGRTGPEGTLIIDYWVIEYVHTNAESGLDSLPRRLFDLVDTRDALDDDVSSVDAVIIHQASNADRRDLQEPAQFRVARGAILIRGGLAAYMHYDGVF